MTALTRFQAKYTNALSKGRDDVNKAVKSIPRQSTVDKLSAASGEQLTAATRELTTRLSADTDLRDAANAVELRPCS